MWTCHELSKNRIPAHCGTSPQSPSSPQVIDHWSPGVNFAIGLHVYDAVSEMLWPFDITSALRTNGTGAHPETVNMISC